ncbi:MAG: MFS transporter [Pseudomonadota bacterium]
MPVIAPEQKKWWVLTAMGGVLGLVLLDETVVGVALPTMRDELGMSQVTAHWVISAYLLVFTGLVAAGGKLGDIVGRKTLFVASIVVFGLSSVACGFATDGTMLVVARIVQGIGAAAIFPTSMAIVTTTFAPEERGMALGVISAAGTFFLAIGPFVGGLLTDTLSWRWIFWINPVIVVAIALVTIAVYVEPTRKGPADRIDKLGSVSLVAGLGMVIFSVMEGPERGWGNPLIIALLVGGVIVLATFVRTELRRDKPLIDVRLFHGATFTSSNLVLFTAQFNQMIVVVFGALYFQDVLKMSPFVAGLALLAGVGAIPIISAPTGRLVDRIGARHVALGALALATCGQLWIAILANAHSYIVLAPALFFWGASNAAMFIAPRRAVVNALPPEEHGEAGGVTVTAQLLGGTVGIAVASTLYAATGDFMTVFLAPAVVSAVVLFIAWRGLERPEHP